MDACVMRYTRAALCVAVLMMSGSVTSEEATSASSTYELTMDITNRIYNDSLLKQNSADYHTLSSQVNDVLNSIYSCATCLKVSPMTFSDQSGTVLVKVNLMFQLYQTNASVIKDKFMKAVSGSNEINGLKINPSFTQVVETSASAAAASSTTHPTKTPTKSAIRSTTKHHNNASSFNQSPVTLASFLRYGLSFCLLFLISYSF